MADDLVTVARFRVLPDAEAAKLQLEDEGIRAVLADPYIVSVDWFVGDPFGNVELQVPHGDVEKAARLLNQMRAKWPERTGTSDGSESFVCLACGAAMAEEASTCAGGGGGSSGLRRLDPRRGG